MPRGEKPLVDPAEFKDKIVFVGLTASGLLDVFQTPFGKRTMPGIQLHASVADSILSNRFLAPAPRRDAASLAIARRRDAGRPAGGAAAVRWRRWPGPLLAMAGWTGFALAAFQRRPVAAAWRSRCSAMALSRCSPAPPTATSSRIARSGRSSGCSAATSRGTSTSSCSSTPSSPSSAARAAR